MSNHVGTEKHVRPYLTRDQLAMVARHYCVAAVWADCKEGTNPTVPAAERETARRVCLRFIDQCEQAGGLFTKAMARYEHGYGRHPDAGSAEAAFGHDFWLTRQGHGAGFWDRKELGKILGNALAEQARIFGPCHGHYQSKGRWYFGEAV